ncbi:DsbA family oxidoreductase [Nostoc flagelliforme FACHB-838]|uniref:DsbA family oxidoreductase n=1 Tax=Nostoc flagelliforme FACHB-838 TaxID=2692904 RepID=A0ABR8DNT4_9NOSO|nr:DsbA family oxidoreductase [Nostoc flagelliforme]MBD2530576.1 DsbA family oxidoreductase [Nostoc flagelliforme FACHB-838]
MLIDIFHDTVCPWCRIGKKHLFDALAQRQEKEINIRWHPFLLDNTVPAEGYEFRSFMQNRKGMKAEEIQQMFDSAQRAGEAAGVKLDFDKISLAVNTKLSHQLIALAPSNVKNDVVEAIYKAYFEDGLNIGNIDVIVAIGTAYQMNASELRLQLNDDGAVDTVVAESTFARLNGINSVPFFVINNKIKVNGSHSVKVFLETLNRAALLDIPAKI